MLLQRFGVLEPAITEGQASRLLGVSPQRIQQLVKQVQERLRYLQPPGATPWLPQVNPETLATLTGE